MGATPADAPEGKLLGIIDDPMGSNVSTDNSATPLVDYVPCVDATGPTVVVPASLHFSFLLPVVVVAPVDTVAKRGFSNFGVRVGELSLSVPRELEVRTIEIIPVLRPVVAPAI